MSADDLSQKVATSPIDSPQKRILIWLALLALSTVGATILFAHAPSRLRLIGIFAVAYGLLIGVVASQMLRALALRSTFKLAAIAFLVTAAGQIGVTVHTYQIQSANRKISAEGNISVAMLDQVEPPQDPEARRMFDEMKATLAKRDSFSDYLTHRSRAMGAGSTPLPEILWSIEIVLAAAVATVLFVRSTHRLTTGPAPSVAE